MGGLMSSGDVPISVTRKLKRGQPYELDWGVVLRPPTDLASPGAAGAYRWDYYDPPVCEDGRRGVRRGSSARDLLTAWQRATAKAAELEAKMRTQQTGHRLDMTFGELATHYLDPARHPEWNGASHASKVRSVTRTWLLADHITVTNPGRSGLPHSSSGQSGRVPIREVPLRHLTAGTLIEALSHVLEARAYGTYRTAHECTTAIVTWAVTQRWAPAGWVDTRDIKRLADPRSAARRSGQRGALTPVPKDDIAPTEELLRFRAAVAELATERDAVLLDLLAFAGPRIGEALALHGSRWWRDADGNGWFDIEERADRSSKRRQPPKHRKRREMWVPAWLADDLEAIGPGDDGWWFGAPDGDTWPVDRWRKRRFDHWAATVGWPERDDYCHHSSADPAHTEAICPVGGQDRRRWRWSVHAWRHHAACYQLFEIGLDPEDVASHLGHRDGYSCWQLYVGARPRRELRLAAAAAKVGDPRA
jgi:integrase